MLRWALFAVFVFLVACAGQSSNVDANGVLKRVPSAIQSDGAAKMLSDIMKTDWLALDLESDSVKKHALAEAAVVIDDAKNASLKKLHERQAVECRNKTPYCGVYRQILRAKRAKPRGKKEVLVREVDARTKKIAALFSAGKFSSISSYDERYINRALAQFSDHKSITPIVESILKKRGCAYTKVSYLLGAKVEEYFPELEARNQAKALYKFGADCGVRDFSERAQYRLSLQYIWDKDYAAAFPYLKKLTKARTEEYRVRGLYWFVKSGKGSEKENEEALEALRTRYPFQMHSLLLTNANGGAPFKISEDSSVLARSKKAHWLNAVMRAGESLLQLGHPELARYALTRVGIPALRTEPEFQLYYCYLLNRAGAYALKFSTLSVLFQREPELRSRAALRLHFPSRDVVKKMSANHSLDELLLFSLIRQESKFDEDARSHAGAVGLMQILPSTAKKLEEDVSEVSLFEPEQNLRLGIQYLQQLLKEFDDDVELALAAYNAGPHRVEDWLKRYPKEDRVLFLDLIPFRETRRYVATIAGSYYWYSSVYGSSDSVAGRGFKAWGK